ncbi:aminomethyl-transferring glycine dehydrogenase subunit GcvPA [Clostridiaceae bacterium HSG29]|nr:aminomethyl-transferring glycine dehydrogenase subunit GcvPA [Clostridiaceae bacterium HSG29]
MEKRGFKNHPYIPNSDLKIQNEMLKEIGLSSLEELHELIPEELIFKGKMDIPDAYKSEFELKKHIEKIMKRNENCNDNLNFLGAGCWQHYVPAICDEIVNRGEFLTAYGGESYNDFGRFQVFFEYQSLVAELVNMEVVNVPTMDWPQAAATSIRMAYRMTNRKKVLISEVISEEKFEIIRNYCSPHIEIVKVKFDEKSGLIDLNDLKNNIDENVAAFYFENPTYLGHLETQTDEISKIVHDNKSELIVGVDPSSLGILESPTEYGADIICGDLQPLGVHMNYGGGQAGFMATRNEEKYVMEFPSRLFGMAPTVKEGEYGFGDVAYDRTSFGHHREHGKEYVGTQTALWGIAAGVYLTIMGPKGMKELGEKIIYNSNFAKAELNKIEGVNTSLMNNMSFKEIVVTYENTDMTVKEINKKLRKHNIFGGKDLTNEFPMLGKSAMFSFTEVHSEENIIELKNALNKVLNESGEA